MYERFVNGNAGSQLQGGISAGAGSLVVGDASVFPPAGRFPIVIDNEVLLVTALAGTTFTVTRGQEGTAAASHADGARVEYCLTQGALDRARAELQTSGTFGGRPLAGASFAGQAWRATDGPYLSVYSAGVWQVLFPLLPVTPPTVAGLAWVNQGGATASAAKGPLALVAPASAGGDNLRILKQALPGTAYTADLALLPTSSPADFWHAGLCLRESSSGKLVTWGIGYDSAKGGLNLAAIRWDSPTAFNAYVFSAASRTLTASIRYLRLVQDATNRLYYGSPDGLQWQLFGSEPRLSFLTENEAGPFVNVNNGTITAAASFPHLQVS